MRRRAILILSVAILLAGVGGVGGWHWWNNRSPYGPEALDARATLQLVDQATANAALKPVTAYTATRAGDQIFLGRVTWTRPPKPQKDGSLRIVLLDKRSHRLPGFISVASGTSGNVGTGSDDSLDIAQKRYPWLQGAGDRKVNGGWVNAGSVVDSSIYAAPVTFETVLHTASPETPPEQMVATAPAAVKDLLVALICVGPNGQVYWAQRLLN